MIQVLEILRRWPRGDAGVRVIAQGAGVDRKTAQRYIDVAQALDLQRSGGEEQIKQWLDDDLTVAKIGDLLVRRGVHVPERILQRFCGEKFTKAKNNTVRVADADPGQELQTDFGCMRMPFDPHINRRRVVHALIVAAVWSRHMFV